MNRHPLLPRLLTAAVLVFGAGCHVFGAQESATALLTGTVRRGPVTPVCQQNVPCDAPFAATFEVRQGSHRVATFASATDGSFKVRVPVGELTVVPLANAPVMNPGSQQKSVSVRSDSVFVELHFDTGIR